MISVSYHAGVDGKVTQKNRAKIFRHTMRKSYKNDKHKNQEIDINKTWMNADLFDESRFNSIDEALDDRLKARKSTKKLRSDAVLAREVIFQLSPEYYDGMSDEEKFQSTVTFLQDITPFLYDEFGVDNVVGGSIHLDETNPHVSMFICPMTDDGRLSQKDFFKGPKHLRAQHKKLRELLISKGYEVSKENKELSREHIAMHMFKKNAEVIQEVEESFKNVLSKVKDDKFVQDYAVNELKQELHDTVLSAELQAIEHRKREQEKKEEELKRKQAMIDKREQQQKAEQTRIDANLLRQEQREQALNERQAKVERRESIVDEKLSEVKEIQRENNFYKKAIKEVSEVAKLLASATSIHAKSVVEEDIKTNGYITFDAIKKVKDGIVESFSKFTSVFEKPSDKQIEMLEKNVENILE